MSEVNGIGPELIIKAAQFGPGIEGKIKLIKYIRDNSVTEITLSTAKALAEALQAVVFNNSNL